MFPQSAQVPKPGAKDRCKGNDHQPHPICRSCICQCSCSTLALSRARVNPHHAGEAYIKDDTVVILATSWMAEGGRPCERRTLSAYMENAQVARTSSRCCPIPRSELMVTPSIRMVLTCGARGTISREQVI